MPQAAIRLLLLAACLLPLASRTAGAPRSAPSRPGDSAPAPTPPPRIRSLPSIRFTGTDYVSMTDAAALMGLKTSWQDKEKRLTMSDARTRVELEADSRELHVDGLRMFLGRPVLLR